MVWPSTLLLVAIGFLYGSRHSESFSLSLSDHETPADWAVKWNGIGKSNNPAHEYAQSWRGISISRTDKAELVSKIESQPASEVYADLLARPSPKVSYYGTCMVGIVGGMPTFWVEGMYGSHGHSGYPKNPASGDGTGHLLGCYNEHVVTGLCSYSDVAERAKQTLLYAVRNDVCTNYFNLQSKHGTASRDTGSTGVKSRAVQFLSQVGLTIPPGGRGDKWITLCQVKARVRHSGLSRKQDTQSCTKTARGEIKETRVKVNEEWSCSYRTEFFTSGTILKYKSQISHQYDDGMKLAIQGKDKMAANFIRMMKNQHMENLEVSTSHDTAKLIATAESAPWWGTGW